MQATPTYPASLVWLRRDMRTEDNAALYHALKHSQRVWCVFVLDSTILDALPRADRRVEFIQASLVDLDEQLRALGRTNGHDGVGLLVLQGNPVQAIPALAQQLGVQAVFANHDDEPYAQQRDAQVRGHLAHQGVAFQTFKDHVVFERQEVLTQAGRPFTVLTPYKNAWLKTLQPYHLKAYPVERYAQALVPLPAQPLALPHTTVHTGVPSLQAMGFEPTNLRELHIRTGSRGAKALVEDFASRIELYNQTRDFPAVKGPSYLSVHLRFGTVSIRELARLAYPMHLQGMAGATSWLNELIWRDFYHQIVANFPHAVERAFKPEYDAIHWASGKTAQAHFAAWCEGRTGYPLVDAAMRQLNHTGYMHNRLRMVTASFLTKDLGIDWRWGERYFAEKLIDFDLAANNGGWQWAASSGCDAQPYFRIFNPVSQSEKFDAQGKFIRRYVPELAGLPDKAIHAPWLAKPIDLQAAGVALGTHYPLPVVDHAEAREATLARYAVVKKTA
jgi:deoxyribodipyrimidine photo-lyase